MKVIYFLCWTLFLCLNLGFVLQVHSQKLHPCTGRYRYMKRCRNTELEDQQHLQQNYMEQNADDAVDFNQF
ncbi:hypothetical protein QE152_g22146 [Popillia japonica]|uniref:Secreted protein n=1 Tax=Popillia japonica TaxID=7064 RepID=A0AAW1KLA1_POPJA